MTLNYQNYHYWCFLLIVQLLCCGRDQTVITTIEEPIPSPIELIQTSWSGNIQDLDGFTLAQAEVKLFESTTSTDSNGYFIFKELLIPKFGAPLSVKHDGYFTSYALLSPHSEASNYQMIQLSPLENVLKFHNTDGFEATTSEGILVKIPPLSVIDENDFTPEQVFNISIKWTTAEDLISGANDLPIFRGKNMDQQDIAIQHAGILTLEITDLSGSSMQVKDIDVEMPIHLLNVPNENTSNLTSWALDLSDGLWQKGNDPSIEDQSVKVNFLQGTIWSIGFPKPIAEIEGVLQFQDSDNRISPLPFQELIFISENPSIKSVSLFTDDMGRYRLVIPNNSNFRVEVPEFCNQEFDILEPNTWVPPSALSSIIVSGQNNIGFLKKRFVNCDDEPISEGYLCVKYDQTTERIIPLNTIDNGTFHLPFCNASNLSFDLFDQGRNKSWKDLSPSLVLNAFQSVIRLCETVPTFMELTIDDQVTQFSNCQASILENAQNPNQKLIRIRAFESPFTGNADFIELIIDGNSEGTFDIQSIHFKIKKVWTGTIVLDDNQIEAPATISKFGFINQGIEGNLQGTIQASELGEVNISAEFNALRIN